MDDRKNPMTWEEFAEAVKEKNYPLTGYYGVAISRAIACFDTRSHIVANMRKPPDQRCEEHVMDLPENFTEEQLLAKDAESFSTFLSDMILDARTTRDGKPLSERRAASVEILSMILRVPPNTEPIDHRRFACLDCGEKLAGPSAMEMLDVSTVFVLVCTKCSCLMVLGDDDRIDRMSVEQKDSLKAQAPGLWSEIERSLREHPGTGRIN